MPVAENATQVIISFKMAKFLHKVAAGRVSEYNCLFHEKKRPLTRVHCRKLNSMKSGTRSGVASKKSMNAQPLIDVSSVRLPAEFACAFWWSTLLLSNWSRSHWTAREFTPSTPIPHAGQPNPQATVGGRARGNETAEKYVIFSIGVERCWGG